MQKEREIFNYFEHDQFARHVGVELLEISEEKARAKLTVKNRHLNGVNIVHGGAIFTLADLVFGALGYVHDQNAVSINANICYFRAVYEGELFAEGKLVTLTPKLGSYSVEVTDEAGELIASFQGLGYRRKKGGARDG